MTEVEDNYRTEAVLRPSPPRTPVSVKSAGRWFPCQRPLRPIFRENLLQAVLIPSATMSRTAFEFSRSHEVTCSCGGGQRQGQSTTALRGQSSLQLPGGSGERPREGRGGRHSDHPRPPDPPTFWLSPGGFFGWA